MCQSCEKPHKKKTFYKCHGKLISRQSVLLVDETGVPAVNHRLAASHWQTLSHNVISSTPSLNGIQLTASMVIGTDCIGSCKSN